MKSTKTFNDKWAECQSSTYNNYTQVLKMKNIEQRIKELNKDFK